MISDKEINTLEFDCFLVDKEGNKTEIGTAMNSVNIDENGLVFN